MIARLGGDCQLLGGCDDRFGEELRLAFGEAGVATAVPGATPAPTALALARIDAFGSAEYRFFWTGPRPRNSAAVVPAEFVDGSEALTLGGSGSSSSRRVQAWPR